MLKKPDDLEIMEQEDARFETEITGKPAPKVEWYQGDKVLKPSKRVLCEQDGNRYTLVIKETLLKEAGPYTVKATNVAGTQTATAQLKVNGEYAQSLTGSSLQIRGGVPAFEIYPDMSVPPLNEQLW